jgi:FlaA1/EpsC-like NDP-sugar epimerase
MTVVTILGAGGKMGNRITKPLLETKKYQLRFVEKSEAGQARIRKAVLQSFLQRFTPCRHLVRITHIK